jgi:hypothetical protein
MNELGYAAPIPKGPREKEFWTVKDIMNFYRIGRVKAAKIFDALQKEVVADGKIPLDGRVSSKRVLRRVG